VLSASCRHCDCWRRADLSLQPLGALMKPDTSLPTVRYGDTSRIAVCLDSVASELNVLLADVFAVFLKTKNFHWHMSGPHFRDFHLMLDEHAEQIFGMTDEIAERVRKIRSATIRSIGQIAKLQTIADNDADHISPGDMLKVLCADEMILASRMHTVHTLCDEAGDIATASLLENWIDQSQRRAWFLRECASDDRSTSQKTPQ
jgi:starvation-inducible DNA-binding protein